MSLKDEELGLLMSQCWAEDPKDRPEISSIRHVNMSLKVRFNLINIRRVLRSINKEKSGNIMDNLLNRMEQYANNLESLVEERTQNYLDEKKRCETLLYELLPKCVFKIVSSQAKLLYSRSVATTLIAKKPVSAQSFESVTIYFR